MATYPAAQLHFRPSPSMDSWENPRNFIGAATRHRADLQLRSIPCIYAGILIKFRRFELVFYWSLRTYVAGLGKRKAKPTDEHTMQLSLEAHYDMPDPPF